MPTINTWLKDASMVLKEAGIASARLDAEIILAHTLRKNRTFLHAHADDPIDPRHFEIAETRLLLRQDCTPIAYIIGHKEFYGRLFKVTPATLIPRPESEVIIELLKETVGSQTSFLAAPTKRLVDVGTGTGCLGITAKLEFPELDVTLIDQSRHALSVAKTNSLALQANVSVIQSNLLRAYPYKAHFILANLPYVDRSWARSPETNHEPDIALFASDNGLHLIKNLIEQTPSHLETAGHLILEADPRQHDAIIEFAKQFGLKKRSLQDYCIHFEKTD